MHPATLESIFCRLLPACFLATALAFPLAIDPDSGFRDNAASAIDLFGSDDDKDDAINPDPFWIEGGVRWQRRHGSSLEHVEASILDRPFTVLGFT